MLIIYAHPNKDGHCGYILDSLEKELSSQKKKYQVLDLYKENYNPILAPEEHYSSGHRKISEDTAKYQKMLKNEDEVIVIYPTWWNGTPAILKGFFDRTLTSGFAFQYEGALPKGLLSGKAIVFTTTGGPVIFQKLMVGDRSLKVVAKDTLHFCGYKTKGLMIGKANKLDDKNKSIIKEKIKTGLNFF